MKLVADYKGMMEEFKHKLLLNLQAGAEALEQDIKRNTSSFLEGLDNSPEVWVALREETKRLKITIEGNMEFVVDNYGTGSLMLTDNPMYDKYKASKKWNRVRKSNIIVGREAGEYTDIFNRKRSSSGQFEGEDLEGRTIQNPFGETIKIEPIKPTNALHRAISWFYQDWFPQIYKKTIKEMNFAKYMTLK